MKASQLIVTCLVGMATAVGVGVATIQSRSPVPETDRTNNASSETNSTQQAGASEPALSEQAIAANTAPTVVTPPSEGCKIVQAIVSDPDPPLNVRSQPQVTASSIVGKLKNGTFVAVREERNGWFRISDPVEGWISKNRTESTCTNVKTRISFPPRGEEAIVKGRIIGGGSHTYLLRAAKGQTMSVTVRKGPLPFVFPPNDPYGRQEMTGGGHYTGKNTWSGRLPRTGDYRIQLDSNFRGYVYEFTVQVK